MVTNNTDVRHYIMRPSLGSPPNITTRATLSLNYHQPLVRKAAAAIVTARRRSNTADDNFTFLFPLWSTCCLLAHGQNNLQENFVLDYDDINLVCYHSSITTKHANLAIFCCC